MAMAVSEHEWLRSTLKRVIPEAVVVRSLPREAANSVLLTFDDGPHPDITPAVLERLDHYNAKAVFFLIGRRIKRAPSVVPQILAKGHLVGNHSHLHRDRYVLPSKGKPRFLEYYRDARRCQDVVERYAGQRPRLFRPPGGRLTPVTVLVPRLLGLRCVNWSREVADWSFRTSREARVGAARLATTIEPRDIVLLHDDNPCVLDLLDHLLPALAARALDLSSSTNYL